MKISFWASLALCILPALSLPEEVAARQIDLAGDWKVILNGDAVEHYISLPGTTDLAGIGEKCTLSPELTKPQLLHLTRKNRFVGRASYTRDISVPKEMAGKPLRLRLGRVMWKSCLEIDGIPTGECQESLTTPHVFTIPEGLSEGSHRITLHIDNSKQYEISTNNLAHAYTDDTQIMWNGVLGDILLETVPQFDLTDLQVYPDIHASFANVKGEIYNASGKKKKINLNWSVTGLNHGDAICGDEKYVLNPGVNHFGFTIGDPRLGKALWSEFNPQVLNLSVKIGNGDTEGSVDFGMREFKSEGKQLKINGDPVFLLGTLECCVFPLTGTPPTDEEGWRKVFESAREWGLNHLRFHSWCPPEGAFRVADRMGFYLQVELPLWSVDILPGNDGANGEMKRFIREEYDKIVKAYGNHPSFCMMTVGNELQKDFGWLNEMTEYMHSADPRHLYAASSFTFEKGHGGHAEPNDDFIVTQWTDDGWVRGQGVFDAEPPSFNKNYAASMGCLDVPLVEHEIGQYAVYPDLSEIDRYTGVLDPLNFKAIKDDLARKGRLHKASAYLEASGKLASILYKEEIERALKTPGTSGIQLLGLQDFPGQGTALIGLVNAFWDSKGVVEAPWFRQFCSPVVPLADFDRAVYSDGDLFKAKIRLANYAVNDGIAEGRWTLSENGETVAQGELSATSLSKGLNDVGDVEVFLHTGEKARKLTLSVEFPEMDARNSWNIWVYPKDIVADYGDVLATADFAEAIGGLKAGRKVLFSPSVEEGKGEKSKFVPVFWSPVHFPKEAGAMGVICNPNHEALKDFPNDGYTDWQWWYPVKNSRFLDISALADVEPIIGMVDNFTTNRKLALVYEAAVGDGRLMVSSIDLLSPKASDPASRQLLRSILDYMNSGDFAPSSIVSAEDLSKIHN